MEARRAVQQVEDQATAREQTLRERVEELSLFKAQVRLSPSPRALEPT